MKYIIIILYLSFKTFFVFSQTSDEVLSLIDINDKEKSGVNYTFLKESSNEIKFVASGFFLIYKGFFSSQDASSCSFTPSCSVYAIEAISQQGFILGIINFFDRFSRCNGLSPSDYPIHPATHLLHDPLRNLLNETPTKK